MATRPCLTSGRGRIDIGQGCTTDGESAIGRGKGDIPTRYPTGIGIGRGINRSCYQNGAVAGVE